MNSTEHAKVLEALLFALGKPLTRKELSQKLNLTSGDIEAALGLIRDRDGGIVLVDDGVSVELRTTPEAADTIERLRKEEYTRDIGRAGLEALAAILYRGPLARSEIDFIRGVNSSQTLRTLVVRGLIRKVMPPNNTRSFSFEPTTELLAQLGVTHISDLPNYAAVREKLTALEAAYRLQVSEEKTHEIQT